jgi:hypothetical protein
VAALPSWLAPGSAATWNASTRVLTVTGAATLTSDPGADAPLITASGPNAVLTVDHSAAVPRAHIGGLTLSDGARAVLSDAAEQRVLVVQGGGLNVSNGTFDLADNDLLLDYTGDTPYPTIKNYVVTGRNTGTGGIVTTNTGDTVLAVVDNAQFGRTEFNGIPIDATTIIAKYTYFGDANLDGRVTGDDYLAVDANLGVSPGTRQWFHGDFNFDGTVTGDDYLAIDANLGKGTADPLAWAEARDEMIALHASQYGGKNYVRAVEQAARGNYKIGPKRAAGITKGR